MASSAYSFETSSSLPLPQITSSSSSDVPNAEHFKILLYNDYKQLAMIPKPPNLPEGSRWITINMMNGGTYRVEMVDSGSVFLLKRGWPILAAVENLQERAKLMFRHQGTDVFAVWIHNTPNHPPPLRFSPGRIPAQVHDPQLGNVIVNGEIEIDDAASGAINQVWNASSLDGPIYVCRLLISPTERKYLIFNRRYSKLIPKQHQNVAMRFIGSDLTIPGAIKTYKDGCARMVKEWHLYAAHHHLNIGAIFVCKIHRGPAVWEFIGACA